VNAKVIICLFSVLGVLLIAGMIHRLGWDVAWNLLNVPPMARCFGDLQAIAGAKDSLSVGFDPIVCNPGDVLGGRSMNYPRLWLGLAYLGFSNVHVPLLGCLFITLFLFSIVLICPDRMRSWHLVYVMLLLLSPSVLLGVERGQTDLFMFFLVVMAVLADQVNRKWLFTLLILLGFSLKLYPVFALTCLFCPLDNNASHKDMNTSILRWFVICLLYVLGYVALTWSDLILISKATPMGYYRSYGVLTWCLAAKSFLPDWFLTLKMFAYGTVGVLSLVISTHAVLSKDNAHASVVSFGLARLLFIAGASIYCGTFILGSNYDYRQLFLLLVLPGLFEWARNLSEKNVRWAWAALLCIMIMAWYTILPRFLTFSKFGNAIAIISSIVASWILYGVLLWFVIRSLQIRNRYESVFSQLFRCVKAKMRVAIT
jgi:hypothetical protein